MEHVVHCKHHDATLTWDQGIEEIREWMINHSAIPGLAEAFGTRLSQWRNQQPLSDLEYLDESVKKIITAQDDLGWNALMFGAIHTSWGKEQGDHLSSLGKMTTGTTWVSQLIRKLWKLQHSMWLHRNSFVHKDSKSMHQHEEDAVNTVIREEFMIGRDRLPIEYDGLFRGNVTRLLNGRTETKVQWIYRVWSGRDRIRRELDLEPWFKNPLAAMFIRRHQVSKKRRRNEDVLDDG